MPEDNVLDQWFLTPEERGNPATAIDTRRNDGRAYTTGNLAHVLIHGAEYFAVLYEELCDLKEGDWVHFTDWRGDQDERLDGPDTEVGKVLADLARRGVNVRGLLWRSHPRQMAYSEQENLDLAAIVNEGGGQLLLDERVRRAGSHHQKLFVLRKMGREDEDVAFVGGIDLCHGRNDDHHHQGDDQPWDMDDRYGENPPWHDVQMQVRGPAVGDLALTFRERWEDDTPLDHRNPYRRLQRKKAHEPRHPDPLPDMPEDPAPAGPHAIQVLRTYPAKKPPYPFAPKGERSIARAYGKAWRRARQLIYLEDQYLWSEHVAQLLAQALRDNEDLRLVAIVPRYPEQDGAMAGPPNRIGQQAALDIVHDAGGDRVSICNLENEAGTPIYCHAKVCIVDDVWAAVGSDNLNLRSWTHDSELSCGIVDETLDEREPRDPAGLGDGARVFARDLRLRLWREHLGDDVPEEDLLDPERAFEIWHRRAEALHDYVRNGRRGDQPPGRVATHDPGRVRWWAKWWAAPIYHFLVDPDGRPSGMRRSNRY